MFVSRVQRAGSSSEVTLTKLHFPIGSAETVGHNMTMLPAYLYSA